MTTHLLKPPLFWSCSPYPCLSHSSLSTISTTTYLVLGLASKVELGWTIKNHFKADTDCDLSSSQEIKMVAATQAVEDIVTLSSDSPVLEYLKTMKASLTDKINTLTTHVEEIKLTVSQAIEKADSALDNSLTNQTNIKTLGEHVVAINDRLTSVETEQKTTNLKFRGFPEEAEGAEDLISFIASFIAQALKLEEGIYPVITNAARMGAKNNPKRINPRDIVATIPDARVHKWILKEAQRAKTFVYTDIPIEVFLDLPRDALQIRRKLRTTTKQLQELHQKYRWLPSGKLYVYHQGQHLYAYDEESGKQLIQALQIESPMEHEGEKKSFKRRNLFPLSPLKSSKLPVYSGSR
ncbi:UNVERIFIED_CONTAM: hypothetical protein K2H54_038077 [Gekko kuhli]